MNANIHYEPGSSSSDCMATTTQALPAFSIYFWGLVDVPDTPGPAEPPFETPEMPGRAIRQYF